jgi:hypothetical protein
MGLAGGWECVGGGLVVTLSIRPRIGLVWSGVATGSCHVYSGYRASLNGVTPQRRRSPAAQRIDDGAACHLVRRGSVAGSPDHGRRHQWQVAAERGLSRVGTRNHRMLAGRATTPRDERPRGRTTRLRPPRLASPVEPGEQRPAHHIGNVGSRWGNPWGFESPSCTSDDLGRTRRPAPPCRNCGGLRP